MVAGASKDENVVDESAYVIALINDLALSRYDKVSPQKRKDLVKTVVNFLSEKAVVRKAFAEHEDLRCSSKFAYQRIARLYCTAILHEATDLIIQRKLCVGLCSLLKKSQDANLLEQCKRQLIHVKGKQIDANESEDRIENIFAEIAKENQLLLGIPALAFTNSIDWDQFIKIVLNTDPVATTGDMELCKSMLKKLDKSTWDDQVGRATLLKLKAKPESVLAIVDGMTRHVNSSILASSKIVVNEYLPVLIKYLKSPKEIVRQKSSNILHHFATAAIQTIADASNEENRAASAQCLYALLQGVADTKTLSQPNQRLIVYQTLHKIGASIASIESEVLTSDKKTASTELKTIQKPLERIPLDTEVASTVLHGICSPLEKEAKSAEENRNYGIQCLLMWTVIAKCSGGGRGYEEALAFIRKPALSKNGGDFVTIFGSLVEQFHLDLIKNLLSDLWMEPKFVKGLDQFIEDGNKKQSSSSAIPPIEGLLAVHFNLVFAVATSSKLTPLVEKVLSAGGSSVDKTSFVFGTTVTNALSSNSVVGKILPQIIAMTTKIPRFSGLNATKIKSSSAVTRTLACCITNPAQVGRYGPSESIETILRAVLDVEPICDVLSGALFLRVNELSMESQILREALNATRQARNEDKLVPVMGKCNPTSSHYVVCADSVRRISRLLSSRPLSATSVAQNLILMHFGSSIQRSGRQRNSLKNHTMQLLKSLFWNNPSQRKELLTTIADFISDHAALAQYRDRSIDISNGIHFACQSLILTLGSIACHSSTCSDGAEDDEMRQFSFASDLLTVEISSRFSRDIFGLLKDIATLSMTDVGIYRTAKGTLFRTQNPEATINHNAKDSGKGRRTEEEEWELQMRKEIESKKATDPEAIILSAEDTKAIADQDKARRDISLLVDLRYNRLLTSVKSLICSDIEIGNSCLPLISPGIVTLCVLKCPALKEIPGMKENAFDTLTTLATSVYEIQEEYAAMMALAITISCRNTEVPGEDMWQVPQDSLGMNISPLPSPCESAATTVFEMDEFQEELSSPSFTFLFPVIEASLMGPRTVPGCEGALRVLERHTALLSGEKADAYVKRLRTEIVASVLELLKHDRAQAFTDPNPYDTLISCYQSDNDAETGPVFSTSELAPLLDDRGALGVTNCRLASMITLGSIAMRHNKIVRNNPLIENRIWLNCFDENEEVRAEARKTWATIHDQPDHIDNLLPPSAMYAIPLLPLLNASNSSISSAAAKAYAFGMKAHPNTISRNIQKLCSSYVELCPAAGESAEGLASGEAVIEKTIAKSLLTPKKKPLVSTGLKKKAVKKSALEVAGIGQAKKTTKKKATINSALLKPKQERTLDQATLESQFRTGPQKDPPEKDTPEKAAHRHGIIRALAELPSAKLDIEIDTLILLTSFLMAYGIADGDEEVNNASRNTLRDVIAAYGSSDEAIAFLLPQLDAILSKGLSDKAQLGELETSKIPQGIVATDRRKEGAVVALGSVSIHLKGAENSSKIDNSVDMLLNSLNTANEDVQISVSDALAKLMKKGNTQQRIEDILDKLTMDCMEGETATTRRGAAYGIAATVKGSGIATLKKYGIVTKLEEACSSGSTRNKEGSLFAIQLLCTRLGLLFEPYVIVLLPFLLKSFGDGSDNVRKAASQTMGIIMSKLSAHGVKLVLPAVLTAFNDSSWRTKQASINMLGSMSHLAPKQLASALPKVVPKLIEAFADTHPKVKASAQGALDEISSVIRNPEIHDISPVLLKALTDPANNTLAALEALIGTEFLHAIDAPSLALVVPILHRGLRDRAATTKRYGALITGNICTMINDPRDFVPYLPTLMPDLKASLLDPIPDVRTIAAKALGSLTRGLGEDSLPDLRAWLLEQLQLDGLSSAERSGAAQGLTEVLIASGSNVVEDVMMDDILPLASHPSTSSREGVLWVLCFLPPAFGQGFTGMLDASLPALINGLSDENEQVREVAMRAGRVLIKSHGKVHYDKVLPILQSGMGDADYRIRLSSLMLLGDLLSMIGGTSVLRTDGDTQDDIRRAERAQAQLTLVLGIQTRNRVLSDIYLARSDNAVAVRQAAVQVWKTVVSVTARTLRQILQVLVGRVVTDLASGDPEKTETAGKCLGDLTGKLGDSVLPEIIPVLRNSLYEGDGNTRRGVCVGLSEVIGSSTRDQILRFIDIIVKVVQDALCDDDENVREMAAESFQNLYNLVGSRALDEVVPALMVALESTDDEDSQRDRALNGLTGILGIRSKELLPYIVPRLIERPITANHAKALSSIATVTSTTLCYHFRAIIPALLGDLASESADIINDLQSCVHSIFANTDEVGVAMLISEISGNCTSDKVNLRKESCWMFGSLIEQRKDAKDFYEQIPVIIRELVQRFNDDSIDVVKMANKSFAILSKSVPAEELAKHIEYMRNLINSMVSDARRRKGGVGDGEFLLPGFNIPKGLEPLLPIYQRGILYGTPTIREASAAGLGEVIALTSDKYLAGPLIIKMTGPLLRIVGDRNPSNVKIAILKTLGLILVKGGPALRAFVPQFQTTFVKALSDPSRQVRVEATIALGLLMPLSTRVDPLIKELVAGSLGKDSASGDGSGVVVVVQTATLEALAIVLQKGGKKAKLPDSLTSALEASAILMRHSDESVREAASKVIGAACDVIGSDETAKMIEQEILDEENGGSVDVRHGKACAIRRIFCSDVSKDLDKSMSSSMRHLVIKYMKDEELTVQEAGIVAAGAAIGRSEDPVASLRSIEPQLLPLMEDLKQRLETHQSIARCLCLCLSLANVNSRIGFLGTILLNSCLKLAMSGSQRVQFAFNDVLWLALDVCNGQGGLDEYVSTAMFEDARQMKSLYSKVLVKIKEVTILED